MSLRKLRSEQFRFPLKKGAEQGVSKSAVRIGLISDSYYAVKEPEGNKFYSHHLDKLEEAVSFFNRSEVDFTIHLGDVKDVGVGLDRTETFDYLKDLKKVLNELHQPIHYCIGNHDIDINYKDEFLNSLMKNRDPLKKSYYAFEFRGFLFIILDTNFDKEGNDISYLSYEDWQASYIDDLQLEWLDNLLNENLLPTFLFCHHPLYECIVDNKRYHLVNYEALRKVIGSYQHVQMVVHGHVHKYLYKYLENIHHVCLPSMVEGSFEDTNSFSIAELGAEQIILNNYYG